MPSSQDGRGQDGRPGGQVPSRERATAGWVHARGREPEARSLASTLRDIGYATGFFTPTDLHFQNDVETVDAFGFGDAPSAQAGQQNPFRRAVCLEAHEEKLAGCYLRASSTRLNGVSVARRKREKPASAKTCLSRRSPACAPSPSFTSCDSELGVQMQVDAA